jgi:hypothetical protein
MASVASVDSSLPGIITPGGAFLTIATAAEREAAAAGGAQQRPAKEPELTSEALALMKTTGKLNLDNEGKQAGRWTSAEHEVFLRGLELHGRVWSKVAAQIQTRSSAQVCDILSDLISSHPHHRCAVMLKNTSPN